MLKFTNYKRNVNQNHNEIPLHLLEWLSSTGQIIISIEEVMGEKEPSHTAGGNVNWYSHYRKQYGNSSKN